LVTANPIPTIRSVVLDLVNLQTVNAAMSEFRRKYDLDGELATSAFPQELRKRYGKTPDERTLFFRDLARRLWSGGDQGGIGTLEEFLFAAVTGSPYAVAGPGVHIDWRRQAFIYRPRTNLQAAFYHLMEHSHLAKVCGNVECARPYFIGDRPNERYCSDACFEQSQERAKKNWWKERGKEWRAERSAAREKKA
jgi:hypothetical protein